MDFQTEYDKKHYRKANGIINTNVERKKYSKIPMQRKDILNNQGSLKKRVEFSGHNVKNTEGKNYRKSSIQGSDWEGYTIRAVRDNDWTEYIKTPVNEVDIRKESGKKCDYHDNIRAFGSGTVRSDNRTQVERKAAIDNDKKLYKNRKKIMRHTVCLIAIINVSLLLVLIIVVLFSKNPGERTVYSNFQEVKNIVFPIDKTQIAKDIKIPDWIDVQLIDEGNPSRRGYKLDTINDIVIHYVGNPGTTAKQNRDFYNQEDSDVCSHFVVGLNGEIIMCVPLDEWSSASNHRNHDTISIEVCHPNDDGKFTEASYKSLVRLVKWLLEEFKMDSTHVIRHYDVTGKECPRYFVKHPEAWEKFLSDL